MVTLAIEMTKKPDRQTCISPGAIGCECTDADAAIAATSPAIPVPAAIIWGAECVIHFLLIWILKQMFSFFPFSFKLHFSISFSSLLFFRYPNIATSIISPLGPALHLDSKQMRILCNASVRLV